MKLDIDDIARCLDLPVSTLDRWIRQGRIPVQKTGGKWSFDVPVLKKWAAARHLPFQLERKTSRTTDRDAAPDSLKTAMRRGGLHTDLPGDDVAQLLTAAAGCVPGFSAAERTELHAALMEREGLTSTGMGRGVAIPHPRTPLSTTLEKPMIVTCYPRAPVDYNAIDAQPVFILFLLLSTSVKAHLHLLSKLAFCIRDDAFVRFLKGVPPAEQLLSRITTLESRLEKSEIL